MVLPDKAESTRPAVLRLAKLPYEPEPVVAWYVASALVSVRIDATAEPSLAARLEASKLGMAMAAIMPIIATTMSNSISEKPSWRLFVFISLFVLLIKEKMVGGFSRQRPRHHDACRAEREVAVRVNNNRRATQHSLRMGVIRGLLAGCKSGGGKHWTN